MPKEKKDLTDLLDLAETTAQLYTTAETEARINPENGIYKVKADAYRLIYNYIKECTGLEFRLSIHSMSGGILVSA